MDEKTRLFYEHVSEDFIKAYEQADMSQMRGFLRYFKGQGSLLDIGCGTGRDAAYYCRLGYDVTAIDASQAMVEKARQLHPELAGRCFTQGLPLDSDFYAHQHFDHICCAAVLMHIPDQDLNLCLEQIVNLLKLEGRMMISVSRHRQDLDCEQRDADGRLFHERDPSEYQGRLQQHGCTLLMSSTQSDALGRKHLEWVSMVFAR
jgi:SAM-dependent methyltransferase